MRRLGLGTLDGGILVVRVRHREHAVEAVVDDARQLRVFDEGHFVDVLDLIASDEQVSVQLLKIRHEDLIDESAVAVREIVFDVQHVRGVLWAQLLPVQWLIQSLCYDVELDIPPVERLIRMHVSDVIWLHLASLPRQNCLLVKQRIVGMPQLAQYRLGASYAVILHSIDLLVLITPRGIQLLLRVRQLAVPALRVLYGLLPLCLRMPEHI